MMNFLKAQIAILLLVPVLYSCGGPKKEAKLANFIQTLMSNTIEAFATKQAGSTTVQFLCGDGSGEEGSFTYTTPPELTDPLALVQYIQAGNTVANLVVTFSNCVIRTCGETLTLDGGTAYLGMDIATLLQDAAATGQVPAAFRLQVENQTVSGVTEGSISYSYVIQALYTTESISSITIKDTEPEDPLIVDDTTYNATLLPELAEGC
jgi:hypothetical protein